MKAKIISMNNCQKCQMLKALVPDADVVMVEPLDIIQFARVADIKVMPFVVLLGEPQELADKIKEL